MILDLLTSKPVPSKNISWILAFKFVQHRGPALLSMDLSLGFVCTVVVAKAEICLVQPADNSIKLCSSLEYKKYKKKVLCFPSADLEIFQNVTSYKISI